uniref:Peptidase C14 caspase domain-containing protein n=1 Tax=Oryza brachyantha TaxID=4533 RepID=J3LPD8_ORYBR
MPLPASYPRFRGKKRALLVGISYAATKYELRGTVNDVNCMSFLLRERFGFPADSILVLTQEDGDTYRVPTRANLLLAMRWLVEGCSSGDSLVLHFSGHGLQKLDTNGDEVDGYDEALCPVDFEQAGVILDDEINETIVRPLGPGVKLHAIVDTCHSGTILDLSYLCRLSRTGYWQWENHSRRPELAKGTSGGLAISISGCSDSQNSSDTTALAGATSTGAMTYSFIKAVESEPGTTYGRLLSAMRATIRDNGGDLGIPGPLGAFFRRVITFSCAQEPQLCASEPFDIYRKPFLL